MPEIVYRVKSDRFHYSNKNQYILQGYWPIDGEVEAFLDSSRIKAEIGDREDPGVMERFKDYVENYQVTVNIFFPDNLKEYSKLAVYSVKNGQRKKWFSASTKELLKKKGKPNVYIEERKYERETKTLQIRGWVVNDEPVTVHLYDAAGKKIQHKQVWNNRPDVVSMYKEYDINEKCGFFIQADALDEKVVYLVFRYDGKKVSYPIAIGGVYVFREKAGDYWKKGSRYLRDYGPAAFVQKVVHKVGNVKKQPVNYQKWLKKHMPSEEQLKEQRNYEFAEKPLFSIVVPLYKTPEEYLRQMIASVENQTYSNWELCLSDGSGKESPITGVLEEYKKKDSRIRVVYSESQLQISENTNAAINIASGDFVVFMDHDDTICPNALYECAKAINEDDSIEVLYSDEDKMTMDGNKFFQPHFKPDMNLDLLCTVNYICHLFVAKRTLLDKVGMLRSEFDGAQDYDFILRCIENTKHVKHIAKILYHWRSHEDSTAENPESKMYAFVAGQRAIEAHYNRIGVKAEVSQGEFPGLYRTKFMIEDNPLISIIIPNKDHIDDLKRCMNSIIEKCTYKNYEFVIVENNSTEKETFEYYKSLEDIPNIHVVYWEGIFNYSEINNFGVQHAKGDYFLLLNNDTEVINEDCLEQLLGYCTRPDVGIVGARLYFEDGTIQHAGVVIGFGGIAGHCFVQQAHGATGYCHRIICAQNYSAVTAACMMVKRSVYEEVGGMSPELAVAFNDIDFCMMVRKAGYLIVYNPYAELFHYESKSRGLEDTPEKVARFNKEIATFERRWPDILKNGDPYYNPNLSLETQDFSIKAI